MSVVALNLVDLWGGGTIYIYICVYIIIFLYICICYMHGVQRGHRLVESSMVFRPLPSPHTEAPCALAILLHPKHEEPVIYLEMDFIHRGCVSGASCYPQASSPDPMSLIS